MSKSIIIDGCPHTISTNPTFPNPARWIGPIPSETLEDDSPYLEEGDAFYHHGGETPAWGGYRATLIQGAPQAHTTTTRLVPALDHREGKVVWWVEAPNGRRSNRCVTIAFYALKANPHVSDKELKKLGLFKAEIRAARAGIADRRANVLF